MNNNCFVILTPGFPGDELDTSCVPSQQLFVKILKEEFPSLHIIVLTLQYPFVKAVYHWHGCEVIPFGGKEKGKLSRLWVWYQTWKQLGNIYRNYNIVGLLSFWLGECAWLGKRFAAKKGLQHFCWLLGQDAKKKNKYVRRVKPAASELIGMSDFIRREFEKNFAIKPLHIIPNGVDKRMFSANGQRDIDILGAGSLIPLKQYHLFIQLVKEIAAALPNINAILCGKGPEEDKLRGLIKEYGLENNIKLIGELPQQQVIALMQRSKLFLHTSNYEGFGAVCIEALAAGCRVISFTKPMDQKIDGWVHVDTIEEMCSASLAFLKTDPTPTYNFPFLMTDSVKKMMDLYHFKEFATS